MTSIFAYPYDRIIIDCEACGRRYVRRKSYLIDQFGRWAQMQDILQAIAVDCKNAAVLRPASGICAARFLDPSEPGRPRPKLRVVKKI